MSSRRNRPSSRGRNRHPPANRQRVDDRSPERVEDPRQQDRAGPSRNEERRPFPNLRGRGNARFSNRDRQRAPRTEPAPPTTTTSTPPADVLRFQSPSMGNLIFYHQLTLVNHTAEGFLNLLKCCHTKMLRLDSRISRLLPLPVFIHNMNQLYYAQLIRIANETQQTANWDANIGEEALYRLLGFENILIPTEIFEWIKSFGLYVSKDDIRYTANVPAILIPKPRRTLLNRRLEGGDFGVPGAANHNIYEIAIAPMATRRLVDASLANVQVNGFIAYTPLNAALMPPGLNPTPNFLSYNPVSRPWHPETLAEYADCALGWSNDPLGSRIGHNGRLWNKQNAALESLSGKMALSKGLPPTDKGSSYIYGVIDLEEGDVETVLHLTDGRIKSCTGLDPQQIAGVAAFTLRRLRHEVAPGTCFLTQPEEDEDPAVPAGWLDTMNASYNMDAPFAPTRGAIDTGINFFRGRRDVEGGRLELIYHELCRLTLK